MDFSSVRGATGCPLWQLRLFLSRCPRPPTGQREWPEYAYAAVLQARWRLRLAAIPGRLQSSPWARPPFPRARGSAGWQKYQAAYFDRQRASPSSEDSIAPDSMESDSPQPAAAALMEVVDSRPLPTGPPAESRENRQSAALSRKSTCSFLTPELTSYRVLLLRLPGCFHATFSAACSTVPVSNELNSAALGR
jgi:hypothetical protein